MPVSSPKLQQQRARNARRARRANRRINWYGAAGLLAMLISGGIALKLGWEIGKLLAGH